MPRSPGISRGTAAPLSPEEGTVKAMDMPTSMAAAAVATVHQGRAILLSRRLEAGFRFLSPAGFRILLPAWACFGIPFLAAAGLPPLEVLTAAVLFFALELLVPLLFSVTIFPGISLYRTLMEEQKYKLIRSSGPAATALSAESRRKYEKSKKISFSLHIILNKFINYRRETEGTAFEAPQGLP